MATLIYGNGLFSSDLGGKADNSPTGFDIGNLGSLTLTQQDFFEAIGDYRLLGKPTVVDRLSGAGFDYTNGYLTDGTISEYTQTSSGGLAISLTGISVSVQTLTEWVQGNQSGVAAAVVFDGDDLMVGTSGNDTLQGYGGNNLLLPASGTDTLIGGSGVDTVGLSVLVRQTVLSGSPPGSATITGPGISDSLTSIERLQFVDGTLSFDAASPAAQIARLYQAALGRAPDGIGLADWVADLKSGTPIDRIAAAFMAGVEFTSRFPAANAGSTAFVTQLYANTLHRAPDAQGLADWVNALDSGSRTKAQVLVGFSESAENIANTAGTLTDGVWVAGEAAASVARLYDSVLDRLPDAAGLIGWSSALESGGMTLDQIAGAFTSSAEFQSTSGSLSNADFVTRIYGNALERAPDADGFAAWNGALNAGVLSRAGVITGISESLEHKLLLMANVETAGIVVA